MNHILCLVDFTTTAQIAVRQSIALAKGKNAIITLCHILPTGHEADHDLLKELRPFEAEVETAGIECKSEISNGPFFQAVEEVIHRLRPGLVVVGTHGKHGLRQNLFGSNIYKLVKSLPVPTLVVNDNTTPMEGGFKAILLPVAPHPDFLLKLEQAAVLLAPGGRIYLFEIRKPGAGYDEEIEKNIRASRQWLEEQNLPWDFIEKGSRNFSVGYSLETIEFAHEHKMDLIAIMAKVSEKNRSFGKLDKENLLLNKEGLPVLCANH